MFYIKCVIKYIMTEKRFTNNKVCTYVYILFYMNIRVL